MRIQICTLMRLSIFFSAICPSNISTNIIEESSLEAIPFFNLPNEVKEMIFLMNLDSYDSFIRAFPTWEGFSHIELNLLMQAISEESLTLESINKVGYIAIRLSAPEPMDPENPDILKIKPTSVLNWLRYILARLENGPVQRIHQKASLILYYFAKSPTFPAWYELWSEDEKAEYGDFMAHALLMAGKIDLVDEVMTLAKWTPVSNNYSTNDNFYRAAITFACLQDDIQHFEKVKADIKSRKISVRKLFIFSEVIKAKAINILKKYLTCENDLSDIKMEQVVNLAIYSGNFNVFSIIFMNFLRFEYFKDPKVKLSFIKNCNSLDMISLILGTIDKDSLTNSDLLDLLNSSIHSSNFEKYKMIFDLAECLIHDANAEKLPPNLVDSALLCPNEQFIKHLYTEGKVENSSIIQRLRIALTQRRNPPLKYFLTRITTENGIMEFPLEENEQFLSHDLITLLINTYNVEGCKIALSKDSYGERAFPFVEVSMKHVILAFEKCPKCLLYFPPELVNDFIIKNPDCYKKNYEIYGVLTSEDDIDVNKPRFSAMNTIYNVEYLLRLFNDPKSEEFKLFCVSGHLGKIESMFGSIEFTPELNKLIGNLVNPQKEIIDGLPIMLFPKGNLLSLILRKRSDGSPVFKSFKFSKNFFFEFGPSYPSFTPIFDNNEGSLLYGLSLIKEDENGVQQHLLDELPNITNNTSYFLFTYINALLKNNGRGKFVLNEVNEEIVRKIAKKYAESYKEYSDLLYKKLSTLNPPDRLW